MIGIITKFLYRGYYIKDGKLYEVNTDSSLTQHQLQHIIQEVFNTPEYFNRYIIEKWYIKNGVDVYNNFWKFIPSFDGFLPLAMRIAAQTVGLDLVPVQRLESPNIGLLYLDFNHNKKVSIIKRITKWITNKFKKIFIYRC